MNRTVRVAFVGQCLTMGYDGIGPSETYPRVAQQFVESHRPGLRLHTRVFYYAHPANLSFRLRHALRGRPEVVVLDIPAAPLAVEDRGRGPIDLSAFPSGVRTVFQRIKHLRQVMADLLAAFPMGGRLIHLVDLAGAALTDGALRSMIRRYPPPTLDQYERLVETVIGEIGSGGGPALVLQGPGGFNPDEANRPWHPGAPQAYEQVNRMVRRVAARHGLPMVDRVEAASASGSEFYLPGSVRYSTAGHRVIGRLLGETLLKAELL